MMTRQSAEAIEDEAAEWLARFDRYGRTPTLLSELQVWLEGDTRREGAFLQAQAAWALINQHFLPENEERKRDEPDPTSFVGKAASGFVSRRAIIGGGTALAASFAAGITLYKPGERFATRVGEIRRVPLADGSIVAINTDSRIRIEMKPERRVVALGEGEAWFQVAKDRHRPFIAEAGRIRVRAVGTAFSVRRREGGADVLVTEGTVEAWVEGADGTAVRLSAGQKAFIAETSASAISARSEASDEIDRALAWRSGQIDLAGDSLDHAIGEFNRYNARKIVLADRSLGKEPLFGVFRTDDPKGFAEAVHHGLGVPINLEDSGNIQIGY